MVNGRAGYDRHNPMTAMVGRSAASAIKPGACGR